MEGFPGADAGDGLGGGLGAGRASGAKVSPGIQAKYLLTMALGGGDVDMAGDDQDGVVGDVIMC